MSADRRFEYPEHPFETRRNLELFSEYYSKQLTFADTGECIASLNQLKNCTVVVRCTQQVASQQIRQDCLRVDEGDAEILRGNVAEVFVVCNFQTILEGTPSLLRTTVCMRQLIDYLGGPPSTTVRTTRSMLGGGDLWVGSSSELSGHRPFSRSHAPCTSVFILG